VVSVALSSTAYLAELEHTLVGEMKSLRVFFPSIGWGVEQIVEKTIQDTWVSQFNFT
jgi:hypothetical protein